MHSLVYCALDAVEERLAAPKKARLSELPLPRALTRRLQGVVAEPYLGLLGPAEEFFVFGYVACTRVKFFFVLDEVSAATAASQTCPQRSPAHRQELREPDLRDGFKRVHSAYVDAASNPFQAPGGALASRSFERAVAAVRDTLNAKKR